MPSITGALLGYLPPDAQLQPFDHEASASWFTAEVTERLVSESTLLAQETIGDDRLRPLLAEPHPGPFFRAADAAASGSFAESWRSPGELGLDPGGLGDAEWVAVGVPVLMPDEMSRFTEGWDPAEAVEMINGTDLRSWWEATRTYDGRWALLPQDRFRAASLTLPLLVGRQTTIEFRRVVVPPQGPQSSVQVDEGEAEPETHCALIGQRRRPDLPYRGDCEARRCTDGCRHRVGELEGGHKVLLACLC